MTKFKIAKGIRDINNKRVDRWYLFSRLYSCHTLGCRPGIKLNKDLGQKPGNIESNTSFSLLLISPSIMVVYKETCFLSVAVTDAFRLYTRLS